LEGFIHADIGRYRRPLLLRWIPGINIPFVFLCLLSNLYCIYNAYRRRHASLQYQSIAHSVSRNQLMFLTSNHSVVLTIFASVFSFIIFDASFFRSHCTENHIIYAYSVNSSPAAFPVDIKASKPTATSATRDRNRRLLRCSLGRHTVRSPSLMQNLQPSLGESSMSFVLTSEWSQVCSSSSCWTSSSPSFSSLSLSVPLSSSSSTTTLTFVSQVLLPWKTSI